MAIVEPTEGGAVLAVKVVPGASRERVVGPLGDRLKVSVRRPAEKGAANRAVSSLVVRALGLRPGDIEIIRGVSRPEKALFIRGLSAAEVRRRLGLP
ncbi:MAG: hypothetical protein AMK72_12235 [Planctomycetes bacterium SM23_25]|nr:MAG: hypothetical protein AMK72_12235 [Planctomycetes bacterium SM23_25]